LADGLYVQRRREPRFKPNQNATVLVVGFKPGPVIKACVLDISSRGMRLRTNVAVPNGTKVDITVNRTVSRGSVCRCEPKGESYELGVRDLETVPAVS
jgi:hypothetical protein